MGGSRTIALRRFPGRQVRLLIYQDKFPNDVLLHSCQNNVQIAAEK